MGFSMARARPVAVLLTALTVLGVPAPARALGGASPGLAVAVDAPAGDPGAMSVVLNPGGSATLTRTVTTPVMPPQPDVVLLAGATEAMWNVLVSVEDDADVILDQVSAAQPDAEFGAAQFGDVADREDEVFRVRPDLTTDHDLVRQGMAGWFARTDPGDDQDTVNALYQLASGAVSWRPGSNRIVAVISGSASNDPSLGHSLEDTVAALVAQRIRVVFVDVGKIEGPEVERIRQQFTRITGPTGGVWLQAPGGRDVANLIVGGIKAIPATVGGAVTGCDPGISATVTPAEQTVDRGAQVTFSVTVQAAASARAGDYTCRLRFTADDNDQSGDEPLSVTVVAPDQPVLSADATVVDFGAQNLDVPGAPRTVTLTNDGDVPLTLAATLAPSATPPVFTVRSSTCGSALEAGQHCALQIVATARTAGAADAVLQLSSATESGGSAQQPLTLRVTGRVPTVQLNPGVGRYGQVVAAVGRGFPPGAAVTVAWSVGSGSVKATADAAGEFSVPMLVFSGVAAGPRTVTATAPGLATPVTASFLADPRSWQPDMPAQRGSARR
jgi:hypothetical protein